MKKIIKKNLAAFLSATVLFSTLSGIGFNAAAASSITAEDLTGTKVDSEITLKPNDFNYNVQISNNQFTLGNNVIEIGKNNNAVDVELGESDVTVTLSAYKTASGSNVGEWNLNGDNLITLSPKDGYTRIKSYSYEYKGSLGSGYSFPAVFKITESTDGTYNDAYVEFGFGGDTRVYYYAYKFTDGVSTYLFRNKMVDATQYSDRSTVYNFRADVEYTYDDSGACQYVTVTYTHLSDADGNTDNLPAPIVKTFGLNKGRTTLSSLGVTAIEPLITVGAVNKKIQSNKAVSIYKNFTVNDVKTDDYTQEVLDFVNNNPIVIDIKNDSAADYSERGTEALNSKSAFEALDTTVQDIITANDYYNSTVIDNIISHIGDIKKSDLTAGTTAVKNIDLKANQFTYKDIVSGGMLKLYNDNNKITMGKNGNSYNSSTDDNSLKLTLNATKTDVGTNITNYPSGIMGTAITFADAENTKIKSFTYSFTGTMQADYGKPVILKGTGDKLIAPNFIWNATNVPYATAPFYNIYSQSTADGVTTISSYASSAQVSYLKAGEGTHQMDTHDYTVNVEYLYTEDVCNGAEITYSYDNDGTPVSFGFTIRLTGATNNNKDVSVSGVDSTVTEITPCIGFRMASFATVNGVAQSTYGNVNVNADMTVDYTNDILEFVNAHRVLADIKNNVDCTDRREEVKAAKVAFEALADENLKSLIVANGYYDADKISEITKSTAEEIASELTGTINMPGATVKMNQIDNNNQLRFTADYTMFESVVTKYADRVAVTERGIYLLAGNKDSETLKTTGKVYTTSKDYISYEDNGATKTGDYWVVGGTADYVSTKVSVLAYAKITVDGNEYTVYSDAIARSIISVIRSILGAQDTVAVDSALATVTGSNEAYKDFAKEDLMNNKVGTDTTKQAFVKAVFTQFCTDAGYIK